MIAPKCTHETSKKFGRTKSGEQRFRCCKCGKTFTESTSKLDGMRIGMDKAEQIIKLLCDGMSVSATSRFTEIDPHTIIDLLVLVGERCQRFLNETLRNVMVDDVQIDEVWQFIFCKEKTAKKKGFGLEVGDSYCFTAVERNTKLVLAWHLGKRDDYNTELFCGKLRDATNGRFHLSSDGFTPYRAAVPNALAGQVDYGMIIKVYGNQSQEEQRQYSPAKIKSIKKEAVWGSPKDEQICTSHTERNNGSMRCFIKRMGRLTYCFSKKWENHECALALHFAHFNFCRKHKGLGGETPAMASGLANHVWTVRELLEKISNT